MESFFTFDQLSEKKNRILTLLNSIQSYNSSLHNIEADLYNIHSQVETTTHSRHTSDTLVNLTIHVAKGIDENFIPKIMPTITLAALLTD